MRRTKTLWEFLFFGMSQNAHWFCKFVCSGGNHISVTLNTIAGARLHQEGGIVSIWLLCKAVKHLCLF